MNNSQDLVHLALRNQNCSQKELAQMMGVSASQISAWKSKNTDISLNMQNKLRELAALGDLPPVLLLWSLRQEDAKKWAALFDKISQKAMDDVRSEYACDPLESGSRHLSVKTVEVLVALGFFRAEAFPEILLPVLEEGMLEGEASKTFNAHPLVRFLTQLYTATLHVCAFYEAYFTELVDDTSGLDLKDTDAPRILQDIMLLAATKLPDLPSVPGFNAETNVAILLGDYKEWINVVKTAAVRAHFPLRAELMDLLNKTPEELRQMVFAEDHGVNLDRIHPDIYTNELLVGMRTLQSVLPALCAKLGVSLPTTDR